MKTFFILCLIFLSACSSEFAKKDTRVDAGVQDDTSDQDTTGRLICEEGSYYHEFSYVTDDPNDPNGHSRSCKEVPKKCVSLQRGTTETEENSEYCDCLIQDLRGTCECSENDTLVSCYESG